MDNQALIGEIEPTLSPSPGVPSTIFYVALSLLVSLPLVAVGAGVAWRLFCMIAGVCG